MRQKRTVAVYFSMTRRRAFCASLVMASASSRMTSLKGGAWALETEKTLPLVEAKVRIWSRTTAMPRSSEALSSRSMPESCLGE